MWIYCNFFILCEHIFNLPKNCCSSCFYWIIFKSKHSKLKYSVINSPFFFFPRAKVDKLMNYSWWCLSLFLKHNSVNFSKYFSYRRSLKEVFLKACITKLIFKVLTPLNFFRSGIQMCIILAQKFPIFVIYYFTKMFSNQLNL